jgi:hypothetical protein
MMTRHDSLDVAVRSSSKSDSLSLIYAAAAESVAVNLVASNSDNDRERLDIYNSNSNKHAEATTTSLVYQDTLEQYQDDASTAFFELANASEIIYRVNNNASISLKFKQDISACGQHTGGIIWETSYLLLEYLLHCHSQQQRQHAQASLGRVLEVGAGCGFLSMALAAHGVAKHVVATECMPVKENLQYNLDLNGTQLTAAGSHVECCPLDWLHLDRDCQSSPCVHATTFDTILGTDVLFSPLLVEPLLRTLQRMSRSSKSTIYICVQIRCTASHALFLEKAADYSLQIEDITSVLKSIPSCRFGIELECVLLRLVNNKKRKSAV